MENGHKEKPIINIQSIKTAIAATLCALIYIALGRNPTFASIGAIFAVGSNMENSKLSGGNRFVGTVIGGLLGIALFRIYIIFHPEGGKNDLLMAVLLFVGVLLLISLSIVCKWPGAVQAGGVVLCIMLYSTPVENYVHYAFNRMLDTFFGVCMGVGISYLIQPGRLRPLMKLLNIRAKEKIGSAVE